MGNRPINRRPFRRPPWRKRREVRWVDGNSAVVNSATGLLPAASILPVTTGEATVNYRELLVGDIDGEWADSDQVLLERLVGDICIHGRDLVPVTGEGAADIYAAGLQLMPVVRMGLVLIEGVDESVTAPTAVGMWENDDIADGEFLWTKQLRCASEAHVQSDVDNMVRIWCEDIHLDVRVKRKLGRRDRLVLIHEFTLVGSAFVGTHSIDVQPLLRAVLSTKP